MQWAAGHVGWAQADADSLKVYAHAFDMVTIDAMLALQSPALQPAIAAALANGAMLAVTQGNAANAAAVIKLTQASRNLSTAPASAPAPLTGVVTSSPEPVPPPPTSAVSPSAGGPTVAPPVANGPPSVPSFADYPG